MWDKTRKRLPTKWYNVGTDWRLVKSFYINYITVVHVRAKAKATGNFCFHRKVERGYKVALRSDETNSKLHTEQII